MKNDVSVAVYIRVSTTHQIDRDSLPMQKTELTGYAQYVLNASPSHVEVFEDAGYSAKNTDRPEYQRMMSKIREGRFSHLLVYKLDRISRNLLDFASMYEELKRLGVVFVSRSEQFDTSSAMGEAMLKIILVFAELERKMTAERVSAVMISRAGKGQWNGGKVPFGYSYDKTSQTFSVSPAESSVVKELFSLYIQTRSIQKTCAALTEQGFHTRIGKNFTPPAVNDILRSPFYIGMYRYNQRAMSKRNRKQDVKPADEWIEVENHHPAIIPSSTFDEVQKILDLNKFSDTRLYNRKYIHIFAGLLICGSCGGNMTASRTSSARRENRPVSSYACSKHRRLLKECPSAYVTDLDLAPFVLSYLSNMVKAKNTFGKSTTIPALEKKLLRGEVFSSVNHIAPTGIAELHQLYMSELHPVPYIMPAADLQPEPSDKYSVLLSDRKRLERALKRLDAVFLYSENSIPKTDYLAEKERLHSEIKKITASLSLLNADILAAANHSELTAHIGYALLVEQLTGKRYVNYSQILKHVPLQIVRDFIQTVIAKITVENGKITSILFRNNIKHEFVYH